MGTVESIRLHRRTQKRELSGGVRLSDLYHAVAQCEYERLQLGVDPNLGEDTSHVVGSVLTLMENFLAIPSLSRPSA